MEESKKIYWVKGNTQTLLIPLEQEVVTPQDEIVAEPYYPSEGDTVIVNLVGKYLSKSYTPVVDGNLLRVTDAGGIAAGVYGVEILVKKQDGSQLRSMWDNQIIVTKVNDTVLQEWDEFKTLEVEARAAVFFFAKGDKGDPFTYADFTQAQIEVLQQPAREEAARAAALEASIQEAEAARVLAEQGRVENETTRQTQETARETQADADHQRAVADSLVAQGDHAIAQQDHANEAQRQTNETARQTAEESRESAEQARVASFNTYDSRITTLEGTVGDIDSRTSVTETEFNEIFT